MIEFLLFYWFVCALIILGYVLTTKDTNINTIEKVFAVILSWFIIPIFIGIALQYIEEIEIKLIKLIK